MSNVISEVDSAKGLLRCVFSPFDELYIYRPGARDEILERRSRRVLGVCGASPELVRSFDRVVLAEQLQ